ncbi:MAG: hypothetical protein ACREIC_19155 [Limisphaerales bacterium]
MRIPRLDYDPTSALAFYEESFSALGALSERTWHDRLEVVAEGLAARVWNPDGTLYEQELVFASADAVGARDANREVFPGCPLTFRLFEALRPVPLALDKVVLDPGLPDHPPDRSVLEKLWHTQYPATRRWRLTSEIKPAFHFSLVAIVRAEIQAIDQHWSLHRVALSLPSGEADDLLARELPLLDVASRQAEVEWPCTQLSLWWPLLCRVIEQELQSEVEPVRDRQVQYLRRELERLDDYFAHYEQELTQRTARRGGSSSAKAAERLEAARAEHARRRQDQVARHEIRVQPHVDALLLTAERAWQASVEVEEHREAIVLTASFVPRSRRWFHSVGNSR